MQNIPCNYGRTDRQIDQQLHGGDSEESLEQIRKMSNRLSQILNGKKEIQLYDLPLFCRLLEISCEDILSAGKIHTFASAHLTNYAVAFSKDKREWEAYVNRENSPILNASHLVCRRGQKGLFYRVWGWNQHRKSDFPIS